MGDVAQGLTVIQATDRAAALARIALATAFDVTGGATVRDLTDGCALFDVIDSQGRALASFAVRVDAFEQHRQMTVTAAGGDGSGRITETIAAWCASQARSHIGARVVTCQTRRRGMVRRLERQGYRITGFVLSKEF